MEVFATYRNSDMTEGRGPMVLDLVFLKKDHADEYIDTKEGVSGRKEKWSVKEHGDWTVRPIEVLEHSIVDQLKLREELRASARKKLTLQEREAIGLE